MKQQLAEAQAVLKKVQDTSAAEVKTKSEQLRAEYPDTMQFSYNFKKDKPPFHVEAVWHDDKFTYIRAHPQEAPALYEVKDGKPNLTQFELRPDGLYFIPKILDRAYLEIGKQTRHLEVTWPRLRKLLPPHRLRRSRHRPVSASSISHRRVPSRWRA